MGVVYLAEQLSLRRHVAFKVLKRQSRVESFVREARAAARINHPNIVGVYDVAEEKGISFIIMEYVTGVSLRKLVSRGGRMPVARAVVFGRQIMSALARAHQDGLIHRDIKPGNILIDPDGVVKVADFGLAEFNEDSSSGASANTEMGARLVRSGTPGYASPEQIRGEVCDARVDLYSAGATLFCMLAGRPPFTGETRDEVLDKVETEDVVDLGSVNPNVPPRIGELVRRMLSRSPDERPADAVEVLRELESIAREMAINERQVFGSHDWQQLYSDTLSEREKSRLQRGVWPIVLVTAAIALILTGYVFYYKGSQTPANTPPVVVNTPIAVPPVVPLPTESLGADLFELAMKHAAESPHDYAAIISDFEEVIETAPGTEYSLRARREISSVERRRRQAGEKLFGTIEKAANDLAGDGRFQEAIDTCKLPPAFSGDRLEQDLARLREDIAAKGMARIQDITLQINRLVERNDFAGAEAMLEVLAEVGLMESVKQLPELRLAIEERRKKLQREWAYDAQVNYLAILKESDELAARRDYDRATRHILSFVRKHEYAAVEEELRLELAGLRVTMEVYRAALAYLSQNPGVEVRVKGIAGTLLQVRDGVVVVKTGAGEFKQNISEIDGKEIVRLADVASKKSSIESALQSGVFLLYDHRFKEARRELKVAEHGGVDIAFYMKRLELASEDKWDAAMSPAVAQRALYRMREAWGRREWQEVLKQVFELRQMPNEPVVAESRSEINKAYDEAIHELKPNQE